MSANYITTDLDLESLSDLKPLSDELEKLGLVALGEPYWNEAAWIVTIETTRLAPSTPEQDINELLEAISKLSDEGKETWSKCASRVFDLGYEDLEADYSSRLMLDNRLLGEIAAAGGTMAVTTYHREYEGDEAGD